MARMLPLLLHNWNVWVPTWFPRLQSQVLSVCKRVSSFQIAVPTGPIFTAEQGRPPHFSVINHSPSPTPDHFSPPARLSSVLAPFVSIPLVPPVSMNAEGHNRLEKRLK